MPTPQIHAPIKSFHAKSSNVRRTAGSGFVSFGQYGAKSAKIHTQADIDYGRKEQARIDFQRFEYAAKKIEKDAAEAFHIVGGLSSVGVQN